MKHLFILTAVLFGLFSCSDKGRLFPEVFSGSSDNTAKATRPYDSETESKLTSLLNKYVDGTTGFVNYSDWRKNSEDVESLKVISGEIALADLSKITDGDDRLALYMNAYNVRTLELILEKYSDTQMGVVSFQSIRNIGSKDFDIWEETKVIVGKEEHSLNDVEHFFLRPVSGDVHKGKKVGVNYGTSLIHFGINCAAIGCPKLNNEAFSGNKVQSQLEKLAREYVNNGRDVKEVDGTLQSSQILNWFKADFIEDFGSVRRFIGAYASDSNWEDLPISHFSYNWALNETDSVIIVDPIVDGGDNSGGGSGTEEPPTGGGSGTEEPPTGGGSGTEEPPTGGGSETEEPPTGGGSGTEEPPTGGGSETEEPPVVVDPRPSNPLDDKRFAFEKEYTQLLSKYVDEDSFVKYKTWLRNSNDLKKLKKVLRDMANTDLSTRSQNEKKTFYINAYNAATLDLILSNFNKTLKGKKRSIKNIDGHGSRVWKKFKWPIAGKNLTLDQIEHDILRPMGDSRIHFAVNCASVGCPRLLNRSFSAPELDRDLNQLASDFVNLGRDVKFNKRRKRIEASEILFWFKKDFVRDSRYGSVMRMFQTHINPSQTGLTAGDIQTYKVKKFKYDWNLNISKSEK